jgi:hypothetical protein
VKSRIDARDNDKSRFLQSQLDAFSDLKIGVEVPGSVTPNYKKRPSPAYQSTTFSPMATPNLSEIFIINACRVIILTKLCKLCGDETKECR